MNKKIIFFISALLCVVAMKASAAISGPGNVCKGSTITLTGINTGGTWTSPNTLIATVSSTGVVTGVAMGSVLISYVEPGASTPVTKTIVVNGLPPSISGNKNLCVGVAGPGLSSSYTGIGTSAAFSINDPSIATINTSGIPSGVNPGTTTVTYTVNTGCYTTAELTVYTFPASITGNLDVCPGLTTSLANTSPGGTWASAAPAQATVNSTSGVVTGVSAGTARISYTFLPNCGVSKTVTVSLAPATISGATTICLNSVFNPSITLTGAAPGGTWTSSNPLKATVDASTGVVTGVATGSSTITYSLGGSCMKNVNVYVHPTPTPITGNADVCVGATTVVVPGLYGSAFTSSNTSVATIGVTSGVVSGIAPGTATLTYTATIANGSCITTTVTTVSSTMPDAGTITGAAEVCTAGVIALSDAATGGIWSSNNTTVATISSTGVVSGITPGTAMISYTVTSSCGTGRSTTVVTVSDCCLVNSLVINTGYNPTSGTAIPGQTSDGGTPITDHKWILSEISSDASAAILFSSFTPVSIGAKADVINNYGTWTTHPTSNWITSHNAFAYTSHGGPGMDYHMTLSRKFKLCSNDEVELNLNISRDNYIISANIDDTIDLSISESPTLANTNYTQFENFIRTAVLGGGYHTLNIVVGNYVDSVDTAHSYNPTGLNLYGTVSSNTGSKRIVAESDNCTSYTCSGAGKSSNQNQTMGQSSSDINLFPNPNSGEFRLVGTLSGMKKSETAHVEVVDLLGRIIFADISLIENGYFDKIINLGNSAVNGLYMLNIKTNSVNQTMRLVINK